MFEPKIFRAPATSSTLNTHGPLEYETVSDCVLSFALRKQPITTGTFHTRSEHFFLEWRPA